MLCFLRISSTYATISMTRHEANRAIYHLAEWLLGIVAPQQKSSATFEQERNVLNVRAGEVIQADLEHMQNDMRWDDPEFGEVRQESYVLRNN